MHINRLTITGYQLVKLVQEIQATIGDHHAIVHDPVVILITEHYYFRNESTLQVTLVVVFSDEQNCTVDLVSGGGTTGLLNLDWGTEDTSNQRIITMIQSICARHGWTIAEESVH